MKRIFAMVLCFVMLLSLVACGSDPQEPAVSDADEKEEPIASSSAEEPSETPEESETDTPAFDTGWASNDFEALIPELPFTGWTVTEETDTRYKLELGGLKTANGAETASGFEEDKDALITYLNSLPGYGFTVEEQGAGYKWLVTDAKGNTVEFTCGDGFCWIKFSKAD